MNKFKIIALLNLVLLFVSCNGQVTNGKNRIKNSTADTMENFVIGNYMIAPELKEIRTYTMIGGKNWEGFEYRKDTKINYETTTLLAVGNTLLFKEYFPFDFDLNTLKIIHRDEFYFLCKDDKNIYYTSNRLKPTKIDVSDYEQLNDFIYKSKSGTLFFINVEEYKLSHIEIDIDENSIKHLAGNYYYDKNGLYFFGKHSKKNTKGHYDDYVENSEKLVAAENIVPIVSKKIFSFNKQIFAIHDNRVIKLDIDAAKIIEVNVSSSESFVTDGKTIYSDSNYGYDVDNRNENGYYGIWYPSLFSGINLQKIYSPLLHFMKEDNTVILNKNDPNNFPGLIAVIDNENYLLANKTEIKIDKMLFYHPENKTNEDFDEKQLKIYSAERFIKYKNVLYFDGIPVKCAKLDMENLREIKNSNYLTDGKSLFYIGNITGYESPTIDGIDYAVFDKQIIKNVYTKEMRVVNPDILSDGITLISKEQKIKIKDLNLKLKIVE